MSYLENKARIARLCLSYFSSVTFDGESDSFLKIAVGCCFQATPCLLYDGTTVQYYNSPLNVLWHISTIMFFLSENGT